LKEIEIEVVDFSSSFSIHQDEILCMTVSHNNEQIVTGSRDRLIVVLRLETGEIEHSIEQHTEAVTAVALTQDDAILVSGWSIKLK
jgi:WD40 repeat protein